MSRGRGGLAILAAMTRAGVGASQWELALRRLLGQFWTRLFLSACIVTSLLPLAEVRELDALFLAVFGVEMLVRLALMIRGDEDEAGWRWPRPGTVVLLIADLLALISFLPIVAHDTPWMRMLRVMRLVALLSYWAPALRDLRVVLLRRERSRQVVVMGALVGLLTFVGALALDQLDIASGANIDYDDDGRVTDRDHKFHVHLWWAFRQIQDPGNMLGAPEAVGAVVVSMVLTVFGLFLVSFLIGLGTDVVRELMTVSRLRAPGLRGHTVIVHVHAATRPLLVDLAHYYQKLIPEGSLSRRWLRQLVANVRQLVLGPRFVVVGHHADPPPFIRKMTHIVYRQGSAADRDFMIRADIARARRVLVLADSEAANPDAETIHALLTIHDGLHTHRTDQPKRPVLKAMPKRRGLRQLATPTAHDRGRLLVAEILDERNLPAAWAAISYGSGEVRTFVVHVERLIGLFMACVARIDGIAPVLEELLSSAGHEIYTCFFASPALSYQAEAAPSLPAAPTEAMASLRARAASRPARRSLVPIGLLYDEGEGAWVSHRLWLAGEEAPTGRAWAGFVALAPSFAVVRDFADSLQQPAPAGVAAEVIEAAPGCTRATDLPLRRIVVCGFRPATVGLLEALVLAEPAAEILLLVDDEATRAAALERLAEHRGLSDYRSLTLALGSFVAQPDGSFVYQPRLRQGLVCGRVRLAVGDRASLLQLVDLPHGFGHAGDLDLALVLATGREDSDARTTQSLLALEVVRTHGGRRSRLRVVAEVIDAELCNRLRRRARQVGDEQVQVYSLETLRASFLFQSAVIPGFNLVYGELLGPWGQSFARLQVVTPGRGRCSFAALAERFMAMDQQLLGVEVMDGGQRRVDLGADNGAVDLAQVVAVWVLSADPADQARGRCVDGPVA